VVYCIFFIFFFQAEDGIRDRNVTGVQTCALPIYWKEIPGIRTGKPETRTCPARRRRLLVLVLRRGGLVLIGGRQGRARILVGGRSEERRVGKECRWWGGPERYKESRDERLIDEII